MSGAAAPAFLTHCPLCGTAGARPLVAFPELAFGCCPACALVYKTHQRPGLGEGYGEGYFVAGRAKYVKRWGHRVRKCRNQLLVALEFAPHARDVLDLGCSVGYVLEAARRVGLRGVGLDTSPFAVQACRERGYEAQEGTLEALPFADGSFDVVTAKHVLEHTERPLPSLAEIRRVLRPGGVLLVIVPDADHWKRHLLLRRGGFFRPERAGWQHHVYYEDRHLADACARAGLEPRHAGKAILRRRLARGLGALWEPLRFAALRLWVATARALHLRRELQLIARKA